MMRHQYRHRHGRPETGNFITEASVRLRECQEEQVAIIYFNPDLKTFEMGFCSGALVSILRNNTDEFNMLVALCGQRYMIPAKIAEKIWCKTIKNIAGGDGKE